MLCVPHVRRFVIVPALAQLPQAMRSEAAVELLLGTAMKESELCYLKQGLYQADDGRARAIGLWQMEPATYTGLALRFADNPSVGPVIAPRGVRPAMDMAWDLRFACQMARLKYWTIPHPLPEADDVEGLADYWGKFYSTRDVPKQKQQWVQLYRSLA